MLQVFHMDVTKVDRDVAYVVIVLHVRCKLMFPMFHLFFFRRMLQVCLFWCTYVLQWFQVFLGVFASVSNTCFKCSVFLQVHVAKVSSTYFKSKSGTCCICCNVTHLPQLLLQLIGRRACVWKQRDRALRDCGRGKRYGRSTPSADVQQPRAFGCRRLSGGPVVLPIWFSRGRDRPCWTY